MELNSCTAPELWLPHLLTHEYRTIRIQLTLTRPQKASFRGPVLMGTHQRYAHTPCIISYSIANKTMNDTLLQSPFEAAFSWVALFLICHRAKKGAIEYCTVKTWVWANLGVEPFNKSASYGSQRKAEIANFEVRLFNPHLYKPRVIPIKPYTSLANKLHTVALLFSFGMSIK